MNQSNLVWDQLKPFVVAFRTHFKWWVIPTIAMCLGSLAYTLTMTPQWRASQAMLVRAGAIGNTHRRGQFDSIDEMKVFHEKVLEVARSHNTVADALRTLPSEHGGVPPNQTLLEGQITTLQDCISVSAPRGAEFGRTEMLYVSVTSPTPAGAIQRTLAVCNALERHLCALRQANADSMVAELERSQTLAEADLVRANAKIESLETVVGEDLGELRVLSESGTGDSNLRTTHSQVRGELRQAESARQSLQQLRELLIKVKDQPTELLATPARLLDSQPALKVLKDGLSNAELRLSQLRGSMSSSHPKVVAAVREVEGVRRNLQAELRTAILGIESDLASNAAQIKSLQEQESHVQKRLDKLASLRAKYSSLIDEVRQSSELLGKVRSDLAGARADRTAAASTSQLTRFQEPVVGDRPVSLSKKLVVLGGTASGFALGAGLVFLFMPLGSTNGPRRWTDFVGIGRRQSDRIVNVRPSQLSARPQESVGNGRRTSDIPALPAVVPESDRRVSNDRRAK